MQQIPEQGQTVPVYRNSGTPTIPATVTPDTPLEVLNLNWSERDLPERERTKHVHRLHPYLGKYIPQLVEIFLRKFFRPDQIVVDPFAGSGTTLVQANALGIHAIGYDISAFNVLLMRAKTKAYNLTRVEQEILDILERVKRASANEPYQLSLWGTNPPYVGLIDYHDQHRYAYELLQLPDRSDAEIGSAAQGVSAKAKAAYQNGIVQVLQNVLRSMPQGGYLIIVAGDKYQLYEEISQRCGVEPEAVIERHVNRRTGRRAGEFYESVFIWRKV